MEGVLLSVAAIIVTHNSAAVISSCLEALAKNVPGLDVWVVDNASSDGTVAEARRWAGTHIIANQENAGFAAAVNQGVRSAWSEYILLLNPDVQMLTEVDELVEGSRQSGLASGQLLDLQGTPQAGFCMRRFPTPLALCFEVLGINRLWRGNPVNRSYRYMDRNLATAGPVEQPAGALLMFRRDVWEALGGLDESFHPVWFEDVDFCYRAKLAGWEAQYFPQVRGVHTGGHSVSALTLESKATYWYGSLLTYTAKHFGTVAQWCIRVCTGLGAVPRMVAGIMKERSLSPVRTYSSIIKMAMSGSARRSSASGRMVSGKAGRQG